MHGMSWKTYINVYLEWSSHPIDAKCNTYFENEWFRGSLVLLAYFHFFFVRSSQIQSFGGRQIWYLKGPSGGTASDCFWGSGGLQVTCNVKFANPNGVTYVAMKVLRSTSALRPQATPSRIARIPVRRAECPKTSYCKPYSELWRRSGPVSVRYMHNLGLLFHVVVRRWWTEHQFSELVMMDWWMKLNIVWFHCYLRHKLDRE